MSRPRIYLDFAASAPLRPEASAAMAPWVFGGQGNPSSLHADGRAAKAALDVAREQVSQALGCEFGEVHFTSGGTEALILAVIGTALAQVGGQRRRVLFSAIEHHAVLETEPILAALGFEAELIPVDRYGCVSLDVVSDKLADDVLLVSVMFANNEIGTWQPAAEVARLAHEHGALYLCDAVQAFRATAWSVDDIDADLISISAHKIGGPKGAGALYIKAGTRIRPVTRGGGQEREMRGGTENVAGIVGFGAVANLPLGQGRALARKAFMDDVRDVEFTIPESVPTLNGTCHLRSPGISAESILIRLDREGVSASSGAACASGSLEPSHVLAACGFDHVVAKEGLRFSFGDSTTISEAKAAAGILNAVIADLRSVRAG